MSVQVKIANGKILLKGTLSAQKLKEFKAKWRDGGNKLAIKPKPTKGE